MTWTRRFRGLRVAGEPDEAEILDRLVALTASGPKRRRPAGAVAAARLPEPGGAQGSRGALAVGKRRIGKSGKKMGKLDWPKTMAERVMAGRGAGGVKSGDGRRCGTRVQRAKASGCGGDFGDLVRGGAGAQGKVQGRFCREG